MSHQMAVLDWHLRSPGPRLPEAAAVAVAHTISVGSGRDPLAEPEAAEMETPPTVERVAQVRRTRAAAAAGEATTRVLIRRLVARVWLF